MNNFISKTPLGSFSRPYENSLTNCSVEYRKYNTETTVEYRKYNTETTVEYRKYNRFSGTDAFWRS